MSHTVLHQKAFPFISIRYELTNDGLLASNRNLFRKEAYFLKFEEIGTRKIETRKIQPRSVMASLLLLFLTVLMFVQEQEGAHVEHNAWIFYLGVTVIVTAMAALSFKRAFYLAQRNHSNRPEFLVNKPSRAAVTSFIQEIISRRNSFLLERYGQFNRLLSYEQQHHNLTWLADLDVLTNEEYLGKLDELNHLFSITRELKGFQINLN